MSATADDMLAINASAISGSLDAGAIREFGSPEEAAFRISLVLGLLDVDIEWPEPQGGGGQQARAVVDQALTMKRSGMSTSTIIAKLASH